MLKMKRARLIKMELETGKPMCAHHDATLQRHFRLKSGAYVAVFDAYAEKSLFACYLGHYQQRLCSLLDFSEKIGLHERLTMNHRRLMELLHSLTSHSVAFEIHECVAFLGFEFQCLSASMRISKAC